MLSPFWISPMIDPQPYQPMLCPVCGQFEFTPLEETDILFREYLQCSVCGWKYDNNQIRDPDLKLGQNTLSLNEYKAWFQAQRLKDPNYNFLEATYEATPHLCPVCQQYTFADENSFDICPQCGWCDDALMAKEPEQWAGNANDLCLNDYKARYERRSNDATPNNTSIETAAKVE